MPKTPEGATLVRGPTIAFRVDADQRAAISRAAVAARLDAGSWCREVALRAAGAPQLGLAGTLDRLIRHDPGGAGLAVATVVDPALRERLGLPPLKNSGAPIQGVTLRALMDARPAATAKAKARPAARPAKAKAPAKAKRRR